MTHLQVVLASSNSRGGSQCRCQRHSKSDAENDKKQVQQERIAMNLTPTHTDSALSNCMRTAGETVQEGNGTQCRSARLSFKINIRLRPLLIYM